MENKNMLSPHLIDNRHWKQFAIDAWREEFCNDDEYLIWLALNGIRYNVVIAKDISEGYNPQTGEWEGGFFFSLAEWGGTTINDCENLYLTRELAYEAAYDFWEGYRTQDAKAKNWVPENQLSLF